MDGLDLAIVAPNEIRRWLISGLTNKGMEQHIAERVVDRYGPRPIPVSKQPLKEGDEALFYFPGLMRIWTEDGTDPFIADPSEVNGDAGQWQQLTLESDGWLRRHGTQLKLSSATHYLPMPPKPE